MRRSLTLILFLMTAAGCRQGRDGDAQGRNEAQDRDAIAKRLANGGAYWTTAAWASMRASKELEGWLFLADGNCEYYEQQTREEPVTRRQGKRTWKVLSAKSGEAGEIEITMSFRFGGKPEAKAFPVEFKDGAALIGGTRFVPCPEFTDYIGRLNRDSYRAPLPGK
jgi:hypothetical protein